MIRKLAISVTLQRDNVAWLRGRAEALGCKSISELLDRLVAAARTGGSVAPPRSVAGTIEVDPSDPTLEHADAAVKTLFDDSVNRTFTERAPVPRIPKRGGKTLRRG